MSDRILFVRVGYMHYYNGPQPGDEKPKYGGSYTKTHVGFEIYNFGRSNGSVHGYATPVQKKFNLARIDPSTKKTQAFIDNVTGMDFSKVAEAAGAYGENSSIPRRQRRQSRAAWTR
jgi:hypothetical protein